MKPPKPLTPDEKAVFEEWCSTWHIVKKDPRTYITNMNLRKKDPKSYENYCKAQGETCVTMRRFMAAMKEKGHTPEDLHLRGGPKGFYDIEFNYDSAKKEEQEEESTKGFKDWFDTYCGTTECNKQCLAKYHIDCQRDSGHPARAIKVHVRQKAPNSWEKYCKTHGIAIPEKHANDDFEAKLKEEMGEELWGDSFHKHTTIGRKKCYDHLWFKCCSNYPHKNLLCPNIQTQ
jgi:hypothetical protein